ncbi:MAG: DUF420 domain-containing protein [Chloroflexi bacterium]|nr:DUF420 domain-containing protein [Chloroflexota bacterium]
MKPLPPFWLPLFNTSLILASGVCLAVGYYFIRQKRVLGHQRSMLLATGFAALFLVVYVARYLFFATKVFEGTALARTIYLGILASHVVLAIVIVPLVLITLYRAWRRDFARHPRVARPTLLIWAYVVISGWLVYVMLYFLSA